MRALEFLGSKVTASFVDVVRYLDRSPRSFAVRRDIRDGMVELLRNLHESGRYQRVVVAAHSLGGYVAYDGITALWHEYNTAHAGPIIDDDDPGFPDFPERTQLQQAGRALDQAWATERAERGRRAEYPHATDKVTSPVHAARETYRAKQFALWKAMRRQGNPWLVTDFLTFGTPMYFADLLFTKKRSQFEDLVYRSELPTCPPVSLTQGVEQAPTQQTRYSRKRLGRWILDHNAPFAVVRWTNLFFPAQGGFWGDWFGGPLRQLFGPGVLDVPITGNREKNRPRGTVGTSGVDEPGRKVHDRALTELGVEPAGRAGGGVVEPELGLGDVREDRLDRDRVGVVEDAPVGREEEMAASDAVEQP